MPDVPLGSWQKAIKEDALTANKLKWQNINEHVLETYSLMSRDRSASNHCKAVFPSKAYVGAASNGFFAS